MRAPPGGRIGPLPAVLLLAAALAPLHSGCAGAAPDPVPTAEDSLAREEVDRFFLRFRQRIQEGAADSLARDLARESLRWLEDVRRAARTEPVEVLRERPFHEILCILALRAERRLDPAFDDRAPGLLDRLVIRTPPVRKAFLKAELGPPQVAGAQAAIGLREAPRVPVFHFERENGLWRLRIERSLPLILQGAESHARQRKPTRLEQAMFVLEQAGREILPEDLRR